MRKKQKSIIKIKKEKQKNGDLEIEKTEREKTIKHYRDKERKTNRFPGIRKTFSACIPLDASHRRYLISILSMFS